MHISAVLEKSFMGDFLRFSNAASGESADTDDVFGNFLCTALRTSTDARQLHVRDVDIMLISWQIFE